MSTSTKHAAITARLARIPLFAERSLQVTPLPGGLTNQNFRIDLDGAAYVARLADPTASALLGIDRVAERQNSIAAAASGVAPAVRGWSAEAAVLVVDWIDGRTLTDDDVADPRVLVRIAAACRQLHAGPRFTGDFDMFVLQRQYLAVVLARGYRLPPGYRDHEPAVRRIEAALAVHPATSAPCHNDLLAANMIDDGERIRLIDYEYAGNNDPAFELGNLWSEARLPPSALELLVAAYLGGPSPAAVARARLLGLMSQYGWTLWAAIQDAASALDFDFWSWGLAKYERAVAEFEGPDLDRLIEEVAAG